MPAAGAFSSTNFSFEIGPEERPQRSKSHVLELGQEKYHRSPGPHLTSPCPCTPLTSLSHPSSYRAWDMYPEAVRRGGEAGPVLRMHELYVSSKRTRGKVLNQTFLLLAFFVDFPVQLSTRKQPPPRRAQHDIEEYILQRNYMVSFEKSSAWRYQTCQTTRLDDSAVRAQGNIHICQIIMLFFHLPLLRL